MAIDAGEAPGRPRLALLLCLVCGLTPLVGGAATESTDKDLIVGLQRLQGGDAQGAVLILESATKATPSDARVWRALGNAYQQLKKYDEALSAYQHGLQADPGSPQLQYAIGVIHALKGNTDEAFTWLARARATRRYDMTELTADPELAMLRADPRFSSLLPRAEEFDHPFVEPVRIIHEWRGEAPEDQFGWIARNIGDVDGDGIPDIVTSAPSHGANSSSAGRIYVYSTRSGKLLWTADGDPGDEFGTGVEAAGDTNHDGIPDVVASGPSGKGVARIFSGRDGRVLQTFHSSNPREVFGNHVSAAGDVNHDGFADILVGAPGREGESKIAGHVYVYSGKDGTLLYTFEGERPGDGFGSTVAGYADAKQQYLVIGAPAAGPAHHGRVYVFKALERKPAFVIDADSTGNKLGRMFVSIPGDMDGDGRSEIYASDWSNVARGPSTGRVYVYSGRTGRHLFTFTGETSGEGFGTSPSAAGDVDGDGRADLIVGAWQGRQILRGQAHWFPGPSRNPTETCACSGYEPTPVRSHV